MSQDNPNPQGKGLRPVMEDWHRYQPLQATPKNNERLFADYFTSMLVLSADFNFRPVVGKDYYLYFRDGEWRLSLIEPERWSGERAGECVGECQLHPDMTWSITPYSETLDSEAVKAALGRFAEQMADHIEHHDEDEALPFYARQFSYYRRLAASGLARSLQISSGDKPPQLKRVLRESPKLANLLTQDS